MTVPGGTIGGTVYSHTVIRVPGKVHAEKAPFVLLMVELDDGSRLLGHFSATEPPPIGVRVSASRKGDATPVFAVLEEPA